MAQDENKKTKEEKNEEQSASVVEESSQDVVVEEEVQKEANEKEKDLKPNVSSDESVQDEVENDSAEEELVEENISEEIEGVEEAEEDEKLPEFRVGDTVRVSYKIIEGDKIRTQPYQGIVIARKGSGMQKTFTVRKIGADNVGVERIFPLYSPNIEMIKVMKMGKVRRAKLYYLRDRIGRKATRIKERIVEDKK